MAAPPAKSVWLSALVAALLFLGVDTALRLRALAMIAPSSPVAHRQILETDDGYHWVLQTQQMLAHRDWRVRHVDYDHAPAGRAVHWSSLPRWWLGSVAAIHAAVTGLAPAVAVEHAALYANPLLFALLLVAFAPWCARHFGAWPAAFLTLAAVTVAPVAAEFGAGSFDHHGLAAACALGCLLGLLAAWRSPDAPSARRGFTLSAIAGGLGLALNAASQIPVLVALGGGALLALWSVRAQPGTLPPAAHWRWWGGVGAAVSLGAYLLEYFPGHLGWRLEVNHPLHALAWLAAGDWLARTQQRLTGGAWFASHRDRIIGCTSALALLAPLGVALRWPESTFVVRDALLWRLHADYIAEFASPVARLTGDGATQLRTLFAGLNALPLLAGAAALATIFHPQTVARQRAALLLASGPALLLSAMALSQERWLALALVAWLAVLVAVLAPMDFARRAFHRRPVVLIGAMLVLLPYPLHRASHAPAILRGAVLPSVANRHQLALRDAADWLNRRLGPENRATVLSGPSTTTSLIYFGGVRGIGTLYWENLAGLRASVAALGAPSADATKEIVRAHGVTHLVVTSWASFARESARLQAGLSTRETPPPDAFLLRLLTSRDAPPAWLRPLFYRPPTAPGGDAAEFVFIFEIAPDQSPALAAVRRAQFLAAHGSLAAARELLETTLAASPRFAPALVALAQLQVQIRDAAALGRTLPALRAALAGTADLAPEDRILAALVLTATRAQPEARPQLAAAWRDLDPAALRKLAPGTLRLLLRLTDDLSVTAPAGLRALAESLEATESAPPGS